MTTMDIARRLVDMCRNGNVEEAKEELFSSDIVSIEPRDGILPKEIRGMEAIREKAALFISLVDEFHGDKISDPLVAGNFFSLTWSSDLKMRGEPRKVNTELCVFETRNGKIISETFFY